MGDQLGVGTLHTQAGVNLHPNETMLLMNRQTERAI